MERGTGEDHRRRLTVVTDDQFIAALCLWREARGASLSAKTAIWWVIQNRANDHAGRWPRSIAGVVLQPKQFSSFNHDDPNVSAYPFAMPQSSPDYQAWLDCKTVVQTPLGGDPTGGATNYESLPAGATMPKWAEPSKLTTAIGPFRFYKL